MRSQSLGGLDYDFLRYIGVEPETQKRIQGFYLPFFQGCKSVVDLGCGQGDFLDLLEEMGIEATGVDRDEKCCAVARERGLNVVCQDVFDYLRGLDEESVGGIFSAHLVEHLPYERVIELFRLSHRALVKGGKIVLSTPNVRALSSHLDMFYLHFGHVTFYHPRLLGFFLEYAGYSDVQMGENPETAFPLWGHLMSEPSQELGSLIPSIRYDPLLPLPSNPLRKVIWRGKMFLVRLIVQPYLDRIVGEMNARLERLSRTLEDLDRPFECYARASKPG